MQNFTSVDCELVCVLQVGSYCLVVRMEVITKQMVDLPAGGLTDILNASYG